MVKLDIDGDIVHTAADGNGPVNALDLALRKALLPRYPQLTDFQLADYKVRIPDGNNGTAALTRVLIDTQNGSREVEYHRRGDEYYPGELVGIGRQC